LKNHESRKVALISGGAVRVGAEIVRTLHHAGVDVAIHYRQSDDAADALARALNHERPNSAITVGGDLLEPGTPQRLVEQTMEKLGRLDILVNNASSFFATPIGSITNDQFDDLVGTNFKAPVFLSQACADELRRNSGCIINLGDIYAARPIEDHIVYCAAKAALLSATRSLARELAPQVRVNAVCPGAILWPEDNDVAADRDTILARTPLGRRGEPSDIAGTIAFLALDAPFISGQVIDVDGGRSVVP